MTRVKRPSALTGFTPLEKTTRERNSLTGFTFIELLISVSIFALVAVALYSAFSAGVSVWKRSIEGGNVYQDIRFTFNDLARDLRNSVHMSKDEESFYAFNGAADEISFWTLDAGLLKVTYRFDKDEKTLIRSAAGISHGFDTSKTDAEVMLKSVERAEFAYCYDSGDEDEPYEWQGQWSDEEGRVPAAVRLSVDLKAPAAKKEMSLDKVVVVPTGTLGKKEVGL